MGCWLAFKSNREEKDVSREGYWGREPWRELVSGKLGETQFRIRGDSGGSNMKAIIGRWGVEGGDPTRRCSVLHRKMGRVGWEPDQILVLSATSGAWKG